MASIFDGLHDMVRNVFAARGLPVVGADFNTSPSYYTALLALIQDAPAQGKELVRAILRGTYDTTKHNIAEAVNRKEIVTGSRAILRTGTSLSEKRLERYFCDGDDREVTLERTITYVERGDPTYEWFNQFNVASGIRGSHGDRKTSVDLVRRLREDRTHWDLIELKEWASPCTVLGTLVEVFRYFCGCFLLSKEKFDPNFQKWPSFSTVRLFVLAPEEWYISQNHNGPADHLVRLFSDVLQEEQAAYTVEGVAVSFHPRVAVLRGISQDQFMQVFAIYNKPFESLRFETMLDGAQVARLKAWVDNAFPA